MTVAIYSPPVVGENVDSRLNPRGTKAVVSISSPPTGNSVADEALAVEMGGAEVLSESRTGVITAAGIVAPITGNVVGNVTAAAAASELITSNKANAGTNVGIILNNSVALSGSTLLVSVRNNGVEKANIADDGIITAPSFVGALTGNADTATLATNATDAATAAALVTAVAPSLASGANAVAGSAATLNTAAGTVVLDHTSGAVFTLTNSLIVAGVHVFGVLQTDDATGKGIQSIVVDGTAHTAVITLQAAPAADVTIAFMLVKFA